MSYRAPQVFPLPFLYVSSLFPLLYLLHCQKAHFLFCYFIEYIKLQAQCATGGCV